MVRCRLAGEGRTGSVSRAAASRGSADCDENLDWELISRKLQKLLMGLGYGVRRLLRNTKTGEYFRAGQWTRDENLAQRFDGPSEALDTCFEFGLRGVELVFKSDSGQPDICVAIPHSLV